MNHAKVIHDVLAKYSDFPKIQNDIKKLIGYIESQQRMFLNSTLKQEPAAFAPRTVGSVLESYPHQIRRELQLVVDSFLDIATTAAINSIRSLPDSDSGVSQGELVSILVGKHYAILRNQHGEATPQTLRADLEFIATEIVGKVCTAMKDAVDDLIKGGLPNV